MSRNNRDQDEFGSGSQTANDIEIFAKDLVRLALACELKKQPMKRDDVQKKIHKDASKMFKNVKDRAQEMLKEYFGMSLVELPVNEFVHGHISKKGKKKESSGVYGLISLLDWDEKECIDWNEEAPLMALLTIVLSLIFVNGKSISQVTLLRQLEALGLNGECDHSVFGSLENALVTLIKEKYLEREKIQTADSAAFEFYWGPKAKEEFPEENIRNFIVQIYDSGDETFNQKLNVDLQKMAVLSAES